jgi:hypothetical protein
VAIQSATELEAVLNRVVIKLDKQVAERGSWPVLEQARRTLDQARQVSRTGAKLKAMREQLRDATETVTSELPKDGQLHEDLWDAEDYVDYRA